MATAPILLTKPNSTRALAVESVTLVTEPFAPAANLVFGAERFRSTTARAGTPIRAQSSI
jgi:hypothetical protein